MKALGYACPETLEEATALLAEYDGRARPLAGGTDIIVQVREGHRDLDLMVDVKRIPQLRQLTHDADQGLVLGAAVPCCEFYEHAEIASLYPGLVDAAELVGGTAIQSRASFGGNLCNSSPAADTIPALIAHQAVCVIAGPGGQREVPVESFCTAPGRNVLGRGELLVSLRIPTPAPNSGAHYLRFIPRNEMDIAVVGAGSSVVLNDAGDTFVSGRVGLGAVAPTPLLVEEAGEVLSGSPVSDAVIDQAAAAAGNAARPISDMRGTIEQRIHLSGVLTRRTLVKAVARARGE